MSGRGLVGVPALAFAAAFSFLAAVTDRAFARQEPIRLEHADSLVGTVIDGEPARQLIGNVRFRQGSLVVNCSRAIQFQKTRRVFFDGVVNVRDDTLRMVAQRAMYYEDTRIMEALDRVLLEDGLTTLQARHGFYYAKERLAKFSTNVVVADTGTVLTADSVDYDRNADHIRAVSNVRIEHAADGIVTLSDEFDHFRKEQRMVMTGRPLLMQCRQCGPKSGRPGPGSGSGSEPETGTAGDTLYVAGKRIEMTTDSLRRLVVTDSVRISQGGLAGESGLAIFAGDSISLLRDPYLWYVAGGSLENQASGDSIFVAFAESRARSVRIAGAATAVTETISRDSLRFNQLAGQEIIMYFDAGMLGEIDVVRTASSLYYLYAEGRPDGLNTSSGDRVRLLFNDGRLSTIKVAENAEGKYYPEHLVAGKEAEYNLPGFRWRTDKPTVGETGGAGFRR